jgi:prepilin-type N-terminal cleavage/methylation domain-containing protein
MFLITSAPPRACHWPVLWYNRAVFPRGISGPAFAALRRGEQRCRVYLNPICRSLISDLRFLRRERASAFTLIELLVVMGIIAILTVLIAPAFTTIKSGTDVTSAANTVKDTLDTARTYAKANNTYAWVGFFEENVASTISGTAGIGRLVMSIVSSKDGTIIYSGSPGTIDATRLTQVGKLTKIDNAHLATFTDGSGTGTTFDFRPPVTFNGTQYRIGAPPIPPNTGTLFQYPTGSPYLFWKAVQFSPDGEARIINSATSYSLQTVAEIGLEPTHGNVVPASVPANVAAVQFTGVGGNVKIYQR